MLRACCMLARELHTRSPVGVQCQCDALDGPVPIGGVAQAEVPHDAIDGQQQRHNCCATARSKRKRLQQAVNASRAEGCSLGWRTQSQGPNVLDKQQQHHQIL
ncbi:hypothetical protein HaLaN_12412 [Haematococcus lacustris]|uniref:Uncharacterized protein n=1 Tax=Haematococcus lacustris TaxID=44745 RepID=A0A699Z0K5_HAELA|nr:hypothetical protein HaLaN_12412 [Haematococcus lacustris]